MSVAISAPSTVDFPSSDPQARLITHELPQSRPPHLPFRRISLPTPPSSKHRESVVSVASFDSLPEDGPPSPRTPSLLGPRNSNMGRKTKGRPVSVEAARRSGRRRELRPVDEAREGRRQKVIQEFYDTEKAYVDGLELVYSHFLTPIIASLDTQHPLLDRSALTSVFSNFVDIWNLHRSFFSSLSSLLSTSTTSTSPPLSSILLSHFPYLSLYTPFITSFHTTITSLSNTLSPSSPSYNQAFASFVAEQESDPRCGKLKLRDWLLTIVQRCPRYLLLLRDLINCTDPEDNEHQQLTIAHALVSKITLSLNTSLHTHAQTLALLALQRSTASLPANLHFISPGRMLLRRGPLIMLEPRGEGRVREFLLFSDCLVWLENESGLGVSVVMGMGWGNLNRNGNGNRNGMGRPKMMRNRSKSEAELSGLKASITSSSITFGGSNAHSNSNSTAQNADPPPNSAPPTRPLRHAPVQRTPPINVKRQSSSISTSSPHSSEEKWVFKGKAELVDLEVVLMSGVFGYEAGRERRFEVLSPEGSFAVYAETETERDEWTEAIRNAKASLLVSLNVTHPNSTLTSSASTTHLRRSLQALPFHPHDLRLDASSGREGVSAFAKEKKVKGKEKEKGKVERRGHVEHWVPPIWIPDAKTEGCMRCGRGFGWRRRRHHCRLCGRCVCAGCSGRTFFISDSSSKESTKPARACDACYETVFPLLDLPSEVEKEVPTIPNSSSSPYTNTMTSLTGFPSWLSMPSLPLPTSQTPEALMSIDRQPKRMRALHRIDDDEEAKRYQNREEDNIGQDREEVIMGGRVRMKAHSPRPRSSYDILEDFESQRVRNSADINEEVGSRSLDDSGRNFPVGKEEDEGEPEWCRNENSLAPAQEEEDTARRRNKRFSMPAVALHRTSVMARTDIGESTGDRESTGIGGAKAKRFSLVLSGRAHGRGHGGTQSEMVGVSGKAGEVNGKGKGELGKGVAASRLSDLLGKRRA